MTHLHKKFLTVFVAILTAWFATGCATKVRARRVEPAKFPIAGIKRIAVDEFGSTGLREDRWAGEVSTAIRRALEDEEFYESVEEGSENVDGVISGTVKQAQVTKSVSHRKVTEEVHTGRYRIKTYIEGGRLKKRREEIIEKKTRLIPIVRKSARMNVEVTLHDSKGHELAHEEYSESKSKYHEGDVYLRDIAYSEEMLDPLVDDIAEKVVRDLVPHPVWEKLRIMPCKGCGSAEKLAREGRWDEARAAWEAAVAADPQNHSAWYNLGIAAEMDKDYRTAIMKYERAVGIDDKRLYKSALERARNREKEKVKLDRQMKGREPVQ